MPLLPGVYWFSDTEGRVLYVGKAKRLRLRVRSYTQLNQLNSRIKTLVLTATKLQFQPLESELEALLVEAELIRVHQPQYNILLKDDKTPLYVMITKEQFPRVLTIRKKDWQINSPSGTLLGPFPSAYKVKLVLKLTRPIFAWCSNPHNKEKKPCFYYHLDQCSGACIGAITPEEYQEDIKQLITFLRGQKQTVVKQVKEQMLAAVAAEKFEEAAQFRDRLELINEVTSSQKRLPPDLVLPQLSGSLAEEQVTRLRHVLTTYLSLPKDYPLHRIEAYDVSNIQGTNPAVAMVTFIDGRADTDEYRLFNIRSLDTPNDFAMLQEAITRRQRHFEWGTPDLLIIDGGKGQLKAVLKVWESSIPVIGLAKDPDRLIIPNGPGEYHVVKLPPTHPGLKLAQQLRDEAHRFSGKQHRRLRTRQLLDE